MYNYSGRKRKRRSQLGGSSISIPGSQLMTEYTLGGPSAAAIAGPALSRRVNEERDEAEREQNEEMPPVKVGRHVETEIVSAPLDVPIKERIFNLVEDYVLKKLRPDPFEQNESILKFYVPPMDGWTTNPSTWKLVLYVDLKFKAKLGSETKQENHWLQDPRGQSDPGKRLTGRPKLLAERLLIKHIKVTSGNDDKDLNTGNGPMLDKLVQYVDYMLNFTKTEKENEDEAAQFMRRMGPLCGPHKSFCGMGYPTQNKIMQDLGGSGVTFDLFTDYHEVGVFPKDKIDLVKMEKDFHKNVERNSIQTPNATNGGTVCFEISPLPGCFFQNNVSLPTLMTSQNITVELEKELKEWFICRLSSRLGNGAVPDSNTHLFSGEFKIDKKRSHLEMPTRKLNKQRMTDMESAYFEARGPIVFDSDKTFMPYLTQTFHLPDIRTSGQGHRMPMIMDLESKLPEQFFLGFMMDSEYRNGALDSERFSFAGSDQTGITHIDIRINNRSIFADGPLEWGSSTDTRIDNRANRRLYEMQKDFWGSEGNPLRHNSCVRDVELLPFGQKWAWISLTPNFNGGAEHIQMFDCTAEIFVWNDKIVTQKIIMVIGSEGVWRIVNINPLLGAITIPAKKFDTKTAKDDYKCCNTTGGNGTNQ